MDLWDPAYVTMRPASGPCIPSALAVLHPRRDLGLGELQARGPSFFFFLSSPVLEALCFSDSGPSLQKGPVMVHPHQRYAPEQRAPSFARVGEEEREEKKLKKTRLVVIASAVGWLGCWRGRGNLENLLPRTIYFFEFIFGGALALLFGYRRLIQRIEESCCVRISQKAPACQKTQGSADAYPHAKVLIKRRAFSALLFPSITYTPGVVPSPASPLS